MRSGTVEEFFKEPAAKESAEKRWNGKTHDRQGHCEILLRVGKVGARLPVESEEEKAEHVESRQRAGDKADRKNKRMAGGDCA